MPRTEAMHRPHIHIHVNTTHIVIAVMALVIVALGVALFLRPGATTPTSSAEPGVITSTPAPAVTPGNEAAVHISAPTQAQESFTGAQEGEGSTLLYRTAEQNSAYWQKRAKELGDLDEGWKLAKTGNPSSDGLGLGLTWWKQEGSTLLLRIGIEGGAKPCILTSLTVRVNGAFLDQHPEPNLLVEAGGKIPFMEQRMDLPPRTEKVTKVQVDLGSWQEVR